MQTGLDYCVYILFSKTDNMLYTGFTSDIVKRMHEHNSGLCISTSSRLPLKLIFIEYYYFKEDAIRREKYLKTTAGKKAIRIMLSNTLAKLKLPVYKNTAVTWIEDSV